MKVGLNSMNKQNSVRFNMVINLLKTVFTTIFPLLIFKYISTILGKEGLGIVNFSNSIVQYFLVLAGLGVSAYATREGAKIREDNNKLEEIASEIFSKSMKPAVSHIISPPPAEITAEFSSEQ